MAEQKKSVMGEVAANMAAKGKQRRANNPKFGAQMGALRREAFKDVNNTLHQVFFGQQAGANEPGTPLAPTQQQVTNALQGKNVHGQGGPQKPQTSPPGQGGPQKPTQPPPGNGQADQQQQQQDKQIEQTAAKEKNITTEAELKQDMAQTRGRRSRGR